MYRVHTGLPRVPSAVPLTAVDVCDRPLPFANGLELWVQTARPHSVGPTEGGREVCTHNSKPFPSYDFGRPTPNGLKHAPRRPSARVSGCACEVSTWVACHHRLLICSGLSVGIMWVSSSPLNCLWAVAQLEHLTLAGLGFSRMGAGAVSQ